jgi:hypothetical protein
MKKIIYSSFLVFFGFLISLHSQIPNAGFEDWATDPDGNNNPVGWQTTNSFPVVNVEPYVPGCQGNYAMKVKTLDMGFISLPGVAIMETGYNFIQAPTKFSACVKSNIMPGDQALIIVALMKGDSIIASTGDCTFKIDSTISQFTYLEFPIAIRSNLVPDSLYIMVASGLTNVQIGTEIIVDEISFSGGSSTNVLEEKNLPGAFLLAQNYPNPFNPSTKINYQISQNDFVSLKVYNVLGNEVATLVNEVKPAGNYEVTFDARSLSSGTYFYKLQAGSFVETKKMMLLK